MGWIASASEPKILAFLAKYNPYHEPAGSSEGGRFSSSDGGSYTPPTEDDKQQWLKQWVGAEDEDNPSGALDTLNLEMRAALATGQEQGKGWDGKPLSQAAEALLLMAAHSAPIDAPIYHSMDHLTAADRADIASWKPGDVIPLNLSGWSLDPNVAYSFARSGLAYPGSMATEIPPGAVILEAEPGARGIDVTSEFRAYRFLVPWEKEVITQGNFRVTGVDTAPNGGITVRMKQESVFTSAAQARGSKAFLPDVVKFNPYHEPAGSPGGGQFSSADGAGTATPDRVTASPTMIAAARSWYENSDWIRQSIIRGSPNEQAKTLAAALAEQPRSAPPLARGISLLGPNPPRWPGDVADIERYLSLKPGDQMTMSLASWSADRNVAEYVEYEVSGPGGNDLPILLTLVPGAQALQMAPYMPPREPEEMDQQEWLTAGKFEVTGIETYIPPKYEGQYPEGLHVSLRQVATLSEHQQAQTGKISAISDVDLIAIASLLKAAQERSAIQIRSGGPRRDKHLGPIVERVKRQLIALAEEHGTDAALKFNPYHEPAGSPEGGRFASAGAAEADAPASGAIPATDSTHMDINARMADVYHTWSGKSFAYIRQSVKNLTGTTVRGSGFAAHEIGLALAQYVALHEQFPGVAVDTIALRPQASAPLNGTAIAWWNSDTREISLSDSVWKPGRGQMELWQQSDGLHPAGCDNPWCTMTHEFGHAVDSLISSTDLWPGYNEQSREALRSWGFGFKYEEPVSSYAATNPQEKFAELFAKTYGADTDYSTPECKRLDDALTKSGIKEPSFKTAILKFNPYHDEHGRFATSDGGAGPHGEIPGTGTNRAAWDALQADRYERMWQEEHHPEKYEPNRGYGVHLKIGETEWRSRDERGQVPRIYQIEGVDQKTIPIDERAVYGLPYTTPDGRSAVDREVPGSERPAPYVYRVMADDEWQQAQERGYFQTDERDNIVRGEGTVASTNATGEFYAPLDGRSYRIVQFDMRPEDGWLCGTDYYPKTNQPIPADRVRAYSEDIPGRDDVSKAAAIASGMAGPGLAKYNEHHDELGRFASSDGDGGELHTDIRETNKVMWDNVGKRLDRMKNPETGERGMGNCFPAAYRLADLSTDLGLKNVVVCHGTASPTYGSLKGVSYAHAWVEADAPDGSPTRTAYDWSSHNRVAIDADFYRRLGGLHDVTEYTPDEMRVNAVRSGHYGPWT
jgi:hypothetical protein